MVGYALFSASVVSAPASAGALLWGEELWGEECVQELGTVARAKAPKMPQHAYNAKHVHEMQFCIHSFGCYTQRHHGRES